MQADLVEMIKKICWMVYICYRITTKCFLKENMKVMCYFLPIGIRLGREVQLTLIFLPIFIWTSSHRLSFCLFVLFLTNPHTFTPCLDTWQERDLGGTLREECQQCTQGPDRATLAKSNSHVTEFWVAGTWLVVGFGWLLSSSVWPKNLGDPVWGLVRAWMT